MDDIEYFKRRLKESDFSARGFTPENQVSGGYTENHYGRNFSEVLNFTIYYDPANGKLSMYRCDPSMDVAEPVTYRLLWGIYVFTEQELDFLLNRCDEYQLAVDNTAWRLQRPPIAGDCHITSSTTMYWGGEEYPNSPLQIAIQHGLQVRGDLVWKEGRKPTVVFEYNPDGKFWFHREYIPPFPTARDNGANEPDPIPD